MIKGGFVYDPSFFMSLFMNEYWTTSVVFLKIVKKEAYLELGQFTARAIVTY